MITQNELNLISTCFKDVASRYEKIYDDGKNLDYLSLHIDDSNHYLKHLLKDYISECQSMSANNFKELEIYEKASCLAVAIRNNPCFNLVDKFGFVHHKYFYSNFAVDVALKFCEMYLDSNITFNSVFIDFKELVYSKELLADILDENYVYPYDISHNFKLELDLILKAIKYKKNKNKIKTYSLSN